MIDSDKKTKNILSMPLHDRINLKGLIISPKQRILRGISDLDTLEYLKGLEGIYLTHPMGLYGALFIHNNIENLEIEDLTVKENNNEDKNDNNNSKV